MRENIIYDIIYEYSDRLIKYCYSIIGNYHDAEDAAQEAFVRLYYNIGRIKNDNAVISYMYRIAYSVSIDILRKNKKEISLYEKYGNHIKDNELHRQTDSMDECLLSEELHSAIMKLKPEDRALVHGVVIEELSYAELAVILGKSEVTLRKRYERARKKLERYINDRESGI